MKDLTQSPWEKLLSEERRLNIKRHSPNISHFNVDYNKSIFSSSFRRLQHKTQVFPLERLDYVRSRLTHSLEVDAIAKNLIQFIFKNVKLKRKHKNTFPVMQHSLNILSAASLIHDIGNPPFGHHGEEAIRDWFRNHKESLKDFSYLEDYTLFDGNCQGFRVITKLQLEGHEKPHNGLNFTAASIATLCKNVNLSTDSNVTKIACFQSEKDIFDWAFSSCGLINGNKYIRHPLSYIMEAADDIANCASDLEDAVKKDVLSFDKLMSLIKVKLSYNHYLYRSLMNSLSIGTQNRHPDPISVAIKEARFEIQNKMVKEISKAFIDNFEKLLSGEETRDLMELVNNDTRRLYDFLKKDIAKEFIYKNKTILIKEIFGDEIIKDLLNKFITAALSKERDDHKTLNGKLYNIISDNFKYIMDSQDINERIQLVVDYISGMTDTFAYDLYQEIRAMK